MDYHVDLDQFRLLLEEMGKKKVSTLKVVSMPLSVTIQCSSTTASPPS